MIEHPMITRVNRTGYPEKEVEVVPSQSHNHLFHVYECEDCIVTFAVEQAYEDHSDVRCPICKTDNNISDVGSGPINYK